MKLRLRTFTIGHFFLSNRYQDARLLTVMQVQIAFSVQAAKGAPSRPIPGRYWGFSILMKKQMIAGALLAASALSIVPALAQNTSARPNFGSVTLNSGFTPDPYSVNVVAGGSLDASRLGGACRGAISDAADFELSYNAGSLPLAIRTRSGSDTTLVVNGPDGRWYCDDDSGGGTNAQVFWSRPQSGVYDIWVGTYGGGTANAQLQITELP
jgi:hypothetical protein